MFALTIAVVLSTACLSAQDDALPLEKALIAASKKVSPAIVSIDMTGTKSVLEDNFFGEDQQRQRRFRGMGSGVLIDADGFVLTNEHVIHGAKKVTVFTADGKKFENVKVVKTDPKTDLAVLKINADQKFSTVEWGDASTVRKGQFAIAFGNPLGISTGTDSTMTLGIVSALNRTHIERDAKGRVVKKIENMIQTDAAISMGNSGGPLTDIHGRIIGINTMIASLTGGSEGIGFAIPFDDHTKKIIEQLKAEHEVVYGTIGAEFRAMTPDFANALKAPPGKGVLVAKIVEDGPAAKAGIKQFDVILSFGGEEVNRPRDLAGKIEKSKVNTEVTIKILRRGEEIEKTVVIAKREFKQAVARTLDPRGWRGVRVEKLTEEKAKELGLEGKKGVLVSKVEVGSAAFDAGIRPGQVILEVQFKPVEGVDEFHKIVGEIASTIDAAVLTSDGAKLVKGRKKEQK
ncbi:MAG: PDZ domain-containing protein [Planctomycetes bacterium]|nr:PDZ domain-containing protein [Planctomycetota bacterium]